MTGRRKPRTERGWAEKDFHAWDEFSRRLEALSSMAEALELYADTPPPDSPGRRYYSNLGFFLQRFDVPGASSRKERELYLRFIEKLDESGALNPGAGREVRDKLRRSIEA